MGPPSEAEEEEGAGRRPGWPPILCCSHLAEPIPLVHEVDPTEVFDPSEHGEEPGIRVVEL